VDPVEPSLHASLKDLLEPEVFSEVLGSFQRMYGIPLRLFDTEGALMLDAPAANSVCEYLNTFDKTRSRCTVTRSKVKASIPGSTGGGLETVTCFCGLEYTLAAIEFQGEIVGKIVVGPYFPGHLERVPGTVMELEPSIDIARLRDGMGRLRRIQAGTAIGIAEILRTTIGALLFTAHKAHVTGQMHIATVRESYRELMDKNRELEEMAEERKEFDRKKSNFLAMVSHELRTPLTSIIGYSDMLTEGIAGELADEQRQFVNTIKAKGDELLKLISSILDFSKIDSGRLTLQATATDVNTLVERAVQANSDLADRRGVSLSYELARDIPSASLDPEKIQISISHLVDNAIKFSVPGGVVKVSSRMVDSSEEDSDEGEVGFVIMAAPDMLEISVEDFGMGIPDSSQSQIFAPFTQLDESSTREHGGAGLGLAIVKHYVEVHVRSTVDEGSRFVIRLPLVVD